MVAEHLDGKAQDRQFVIRPNCSVSRFGAYMFFAVILFATLIVSGYFVSLGAWMVLPFAGLEMMVLGGALHLFLSAAERKELITVTGQSLRVERSSRPARTETWDFHTYWVQVVLRGDPATWHPSRLFLRSHGREVLIGECLTESERRQLAYDLSECMAAYR